MEKDLKLKVYDLSNKLQIVLSYLEQKEYDKSLAACKAAIKELRAVAVGLSELQVRGGRRSTDHLPMGEIGTAIRNVADVVESAVNEAENVIKPGPDDIKK